MANYYAPLEPVSDYQVPPTPLFPRKREVCSFLRHSVRLVAEGVAGPARICNAGAGCRDTKVAPRGRGGQEDGAGLLSRVFAAAHPCQTAHGRFTNRPYRGAGGGAWGSVPRVGEGSTLVRMLQEGWRNYGIGADWWVEMVQTWGRRGSCVGLDGSEPGNGWHARVTFFSGTGSEWVGCGRGCVAGVCVGASGGHWLSNMANARRWR